MTKRESCLRWRMAVPGKDPARKCTRQGGEFTASFIIDCNVLLYCWSTVEISLADRTRLDKLNV